MQKGVLKIVRGCYYYFPLVCYIQMSNNLHACVSSAQLVLCIDVITTSPLSKAKPRQEAEPCRWPCVTTSCPGTSWAAPRRRASASATRWVVSARWVGWAESSRDWLQLQECLAAGWTVSHTGLLLFLSLLFSLLFHPPPLPQPHYHLTPFLSFPPSSSSSFIPPLLFIYGLDITTVIVFFTVLIYI